MQTRYIIAVITGTVFMAGGLISGMVSSPAIAQNNSIPVPGCLTAKLCAPIGQVQPTTASNYAYSSSFVSVSGTETSGSVEMTTTAQGTKEPDGQWTGSAGYGGNHSLGNFVIAGTCVTSSDCQSQSNPPEIEITETVGQDYCNSGGYYPCFAIDIWRNGTWLGAKDTTDYTEDTSEGYGIPNNGTYALATGTNTLGYELSYGRVNITVNGNIVGWVPDSVWGQTTFGPITEESIQSEVYQAEADWSGSPLPSMDYTFSNFTDSNGNTLPTPSVSTDYTISNASGTGWTVSGGSAPSDSGAYFPFEGGEDSNYCLGNHNNDGSNGNPIVNWACSSPGEAQNWFWNYANDEVVNQDGSCLADPSDSTTSGTQLEIYTCNGSAGEQWVPEGIGNNYSQFINGSGLCLSNNDSTSNDTAVEVVTCSTTAGQEWDAFIGN